MDAKDVLLLGAVAAALCAVLPLGTLGMPAAALLLI